ncbi:hypothetical protein NDA13_003367 [Ustilago tritici]|nr:hypothetical protein NDA13_003367 [Ustilago tritici]
MLTSLPPFLFVIVARSPSKKMRVCGRSSRHQSWWLFVIAPSYVLILTFSSADPKPPGGAISDNKDPYPPQNRITNIQQGSVMDEEAVEAARVKTATGRALQQSNPELSTGVSDVTKAVSSSGVPSPRLNVDLLASKSAKSIGEGAQSFVNAPRVHHGEHFGASKDIVLRYPGEEVVVQGWPEKLFFFTPRTHLDDRGPFMIHSQLSAKQKKAVNQVLRRHKFRLAAKDVYLDRIDGKGEHMFGRFDIPGHGVETLHVSSRRDFLPPWHKIPVVYRSKVSFGRIFGTPISRLPSHISSWLKDDHAEVYENLAKARLRKRAPVPPQNYMTAA